MCQRLRSTWHIGPSQLTAWHIRVVCPIRLLLLQARVAVLMSMLQAVNDELGLSLALERSPREDLREEQFLQNISRCQAALKEHGRVLRQTRAGRWIQRMRMQKQTLPSKYVSALDRTLPGWDKASKRRMRQARPSSS
jgi:hypothetical protein